jgi:hypothetical protein
VKQRLERALRAIDSLPEDDWQPEHWDTFSVARTVIGEELGRLDRTATRKPSVKRQRPGWWILTDARQVVYVRSGGVCEASTPVCTGMGVHVHHKAGRTGPNPHDPAGLLHVCSSCHVHIHANPTESYDHGWLVKRLGAL